MNTSTQWRPTAPLSVLRKRADIFYQIREFFRTRQVWEVDTPILGCAGVSDPHLRNLVTHYHTPTKALSEGIRFLQTSPEYAMKRLLAAGSGSIYQLGKVFRDEENGTCHQREFTLLEWYRVGWSDEQLMDEVKSLISLILGEKKWTVVTYRHLFENVLQINPHGVSVDELSKIASQHIDHDLQLSSKDGWLDLLFTHMIEPALKEMGRVIVTQYPASQAALAQTFQNETGEWVSKRFEVYVDGIELANGYQELQDEQEQRRRFNEEKSKRRAMNLPDTVIDECFLAAMKEGLPLCAGVALGVDRLIMLCMKAAHIAHVLPFGDLD